MMKLHSSFQPMLIDSNQSSIHSSKQKMVLSSFSFDESVRRRLRFNIDDSEYLHLSAKWQYSDRNTDYSDHDVKAMKLAISQCFPIEFTCDAVNNVQTLSHSWSELFVIIYQLDSFNDKAINVLKTERSLSSIISLLLDVIGRSNDGGSKSDIDSSTVLGILPAAVTLFSFLLDYCDRKSAILTENNSLQLLKLLMNRCVYPSNSATCKNHAMEAYTCRLGVKRLLLTNNMYRLKIIDDELVGFLCKWWQRWVNYSSDSQSVNDIDVSYLNAMELTVQLIQINSNLLDSLFLKVTPLSMSSMARYWFHSDIVLASTSQYLTTRLLSFYASKSFKPFVTMEIVQSVEKNLNQLLDSYFASRSLGSSHRSVHRVPLTEIKENIIHTSLSLKSHESIHKKERESKMNSKYDEQVWDGLVQAFYEPILITGLLLYAWLIHPSILSIGDFFSNQSINAICMRYLQILSGKVSNCRSNALEHSDGQICALLLIQILVRDHNNIQNGDFDVFIHENLSVHEILKQIDPSIFDHPFPAIYSDIIRCDDMRRLLARKQKEQDSFGEPKLEPNNENVCDNFQMMERNEGNIDIVSPSPHAISNINHSPTFQNGSSIDESNARLDSLQTVIGDLHQQINEIKKENLSLKMSQSDLKIANATQSQTIQSQSILLKSSYHNLAVITQKYDALALECQQIQQKNEIFDQENRLVSQRLSQYQQSSVRLHDEINQWKMKYNTMSEALDALQTTCKTQELRIKSHEQENQHKDTIICHQQHELQTLQHDVTKHMQTIEEMDNNRKFLQDNLDEQLYLNQELNQNIIEKDLSIKSKDEKIFDLHRQIEEFKIKLQKSNHEVRHYQDIISCINQLASKSSQSSKGTIDEITDLN